MNTSCIKHIIWLWLLNMQEWKKQYFTWNFKILLIQYNPKVHFLPMGENIDFNSNQH